MLLKLRLQRGGKKGQPNFRIVLQEHTDAVKREAIEVLGYYKPALDPKVLKVDLERVKYWISKGAQPSDPLAALLKKEGLEGMDKYMEPRDKKKKKKGEEEDKPEAPAAAPAAEAPAEEAPAEEAPAEEKPAEPEAPAEEPAPAEEAPKEQ
ncbi:30S ribosomal protein S16 [Candidatus Peregrinibacteria bacterium]|nr:30S ribosomal protein S16 [Candidatus Peregrinibacteria bacterium]MBT4147853.1 30S ribosomal protein S16 [Candidatus Peregrinibacteria bacterium]MBT4366194.1 30S ribosomal protein S16 [Candidatus Peregrinibacteria bacterium]MBT4456319.1 30S ribosomal protein S16 [Candidatus Peregrinibacteria bacterium]